jgi:hypothetical protein
LSQPSGSLPKRGKEGEGEGNMEVGMILSDDKRTYPCSWISPK